MVRIDIEYGGELHTVCRHEPSGATLSTDAPVDNQGLGQAFSPTDLLATSVGTCMLTVMGILAKRKGWPLEGAKVEVDKHMHDGADRRVARLDLRFAMPDAVPEDARAVLERAAMTCPVKRSLHPDLEVATRFDWV